CSSSAKLRNPMLITATFASKPVVHYQWSPVAGGNKKLARLLERLQ
ncbi:hypothetical protein ACUOCP_56280, partial [Escherichia sp. R-CC3]